MVVINKLLLCRIVGNMIFFFAHLHCKEDFGVVSLVRKQTFLVTSGLVSGDKSGACPARCFLAHHIL